jgi:D-alanyl-D-alanine carboxypeptidase
MLKFLWLLAVILFSTALFSAPKAKKAELRLQEDYSNTAYVVIDYNNGELLYGQNEDKIMYPASLTKIMTLFVVFDKIKNEEISFDDVVVFSRKAASQEPSKLGLPAGSKITMGEAILSMIVKSHNDVSVAVAEHISGTEANFIELMNAKAKELGLENTRFNSSHGLHRENQYTTAIDMAKLSRAIMMEHNNFYDFFALDSFNWKNKKYNNHNHLLGYNRVDGIKTGYTKASGYNLISSSQKGSLRIISVAMGFDSVNSRDEYMKKIIDEGFLHAQLSRENILNYLQKPRWIPNNNLSTLHEDHKESLDSDIASDNYVVAKNDYLGYSIERVSYLDAITSEEKIYIKPSVTYTKTPARKTKGNYVIQVGAFSNYSSALNEAYNTLKYKAVGKNISKKNVVVDKSPTNHYVAKFVNLDKDTAYKTCDFIKSKGGDCFVRTS